MPDVTLQTLVILLDHHATFETARFEGVLHPKAPGAEKPNRLLRRDRAWSAVEKLILNQPLAEPEIQAAREVLDWYSEIPEARRLPIRAARDLLDNWHLPPDAVGPEGIDDVVFGLFDRWVSEEAIAQADTPSIDGDRSNSADRASIVLGSADIDPRVSKAYERARFGFHQFALKLGDDDANGALGALEEIESELETARRALEEGHQ